MSPSGVSVTSQETLRAERSARLTAAFEWPMLVASLLVVPTILIENARLGPGWTAAATVVNWVVWIAFVIEYVVLLAAVPDRWRWIRTHLLELAIIVLSPPFGPAGLQSARAFRLLRLLRLVRVAKLAKSLFSLDGAAWAALIAFLLIEACGVALVVVEGTSHQPHLTVVDGLWWAISTVTTVGYGDVTAMTSAGRLIGICIMLIGLGFIGVVTGAIAQHFVASAANEAEAESANEILAAVHDVKAEIARLHDRVGRIEDSLCATRSSPSAPPDRRGQPARARRRSTGGRSRGRPNGVDARSGTTIRSTRGGRPTGRP